LLIDILSKQLLYRLNLLSIRSGSWLSKQVMVKY